MGGAPSFDKHTERDSWLLGLKGTLGGLAATLYQRIRPKDQLVYERFESQKFFKDAPRLDQMLADGSEGRDAIIVSGDQKLEHFIDRELYQRKEMSEYQTLSELAKFLEVAQQNSDILGVELSELAGQIHENLAYIGYKELNEASKGIAEYIKSLLRSDKDQSICLVTSGKTTGCFSDDLTREQKSDTFLLNAILGNFSDDEMKQFKTQLSIDPSSFPMGYQSRSKARAIFLDDWSATGRQVSQEVLGFKGVQEAYNSETKGDHVKIDREVCLVVASESLIDRGFEYADGETVLPVRAYYRANSPDTDYKMMSKREKCSALPGFIAGSHSSIDFVLEVAIREIVKKANSCRHKGVEVPDILTLMPPGVLVERQYRRQEFFPKDIDRFYRLTGWYDKQNQLFGSIIYPMAR